MYLLKLLFFRKNSPIVSDTDVKDCTFSGWREIAGIVDYYVEAAIISSKLIFSSVSAE